MKKFDCSVGKTKYTLEEQTPDTYVKFTRVNGDGTQTTFIPVELVLGFAAERITARLVKSVLGR